MKKRLLCLFLCFVMLLSVGLTSCSQKSDKEAEDDVKDKASETAKTLTMWLVSEEEVSASTAAAVTKAVNSITQSKFKINLILNFFTKDEYEAKLTETITAYENAKKKQDAVTTAPETEAETETGETAEVTDETMTNEFGMSIIKWPEAVANQVDIIWIGGDDGKGEEMYVNFIEKGWLKELDTDLSSSSKKIKEYVSATLLNAAQYNGTTYAIPNNHAIGEYTYMLLNKELMQKYSQQGYVKTGMIDGFYNENLYSFLNLVYKFEDQDQVVAIDSTYDRCLELLAHYWSIDPETYNTLEGFSVFGHHYKTQEELTRGSVILGFDSLFEDQEFVEDYLKLNQFKFDGYFGDAEKENKTAALKLIKGDYSIQTQFDADGNCVYTLDGVEYYPIVVEYPTASSYDIYGNMFGVCTYTQNLARSMEIVTYLNTNADFRNLLQYGIENTNYKLIKDDSGKVVDIERLNNSYMMDIFATGNAFIAYPEPEMSADIWESGKAQNRESLINPLLGLNFADYAASTGPAAEEVKVGDAGYTISYTTGYSKDVLSQNATLDAWLKECDAAGKGIYTLKTSSVSGQVLTAKYYVYNNNLSNNTKFGVEVVPEMPETVEEGKEATPGGYDFVFTYTDATGNSASGYELSVVDLVTRKTTKFETPAKVNGADAALTVKEQNSLLVFDFLNTKEYSIEVYADLSKTVFVKNSDLIKWINSSDAANSNKPTTYLLSYESAEKDGKVETTYVVYRTGLQHVTASELVPTGDFGELTLTFNYSHNEEDTLEKTEPNYVLYYVRVTADADVEVNYCITSNGEEENVFKSNIEARTEANGDADPDFDMVGNLDTEVVKYMYNLNKVLVEKLNACQNIDELKALIAELQLLLNTKSTPASSAFKVLEDVVKDKATFVNVSTIHSNVKAITSHEIIKNMMLADDAETDDDLVEAPYVDINARQEEYVYFDSPYGIYYAWMTQYGFLPSEKK